jgi:hypothetical protein
VEYAGRNQVQGEFPVFVDNRMAGIAAALVPYDDIIPVGQQIDHAAFSFISPIDPDNSAV